MARALIALALLMAAACGGSAPGPAAASSATAKASATPTPVESASILGSWHVTVSTTQVYGDLSNKVGEQYTREWTLTKDCPAAGCVALLQTDTGTGPATLNWFYESGVYKAQLTVTADCPNTEGGNFAVSAQYALVVNAATTEGGTFRGNAFAGTFVEDLVPNAAARAQGCRQSHIEQRMVGARTG